MKDLQFSFEFFPPKTPEAEIKLWENIRSLEKLKPSFVSVTYGAGGTTREKTHEIVKRIRQETTLEPAAHLTCVNATKSEIDEIAREYWHSGVRHIVALRGDPPGMSGDYVPHPGGYQYAADLVTGLKKIADFEISVAAYPEKHPAAGDLDRDMQHLKQKVDAGAERAITQFFFNADDYFIFIEKAVKLGIKVPIVPGILPIANFSQAQKFAAMCGAKIPESIAGRFARLDDNERDKNKVSIEVATELTKKLIDNDVKQVHFYTLNRADLVQGILSNLGVS